MMTKKRSDNWKKPNNTVRVRRLNGKKQVIPQEFVGLHGKKPGDESLN